MNFLQNLGIVVNLDVYQEEIASNPDSGEPKIKASGRFYLEGREFSCESSLVEPVAQKDTIQAVLTDLVKQFVEALPL